MQYRYRITYLTKTVEDNHGEFSDEQMTREYAVDSITNDLNELFTDLLDKHRHDGLVGMEILQVETLSGAQYVAENMRLIDLPTLV